MAFGPSKRRPDNSGINFADKNSVEQYEAKATIDTENSGNNDDQPQADLEKIGSAPKAPDSAPPGNEQEKSKYYRP
jgi:hypothetical protein